MKCDLFVKNYPEEKISQLYGHKEMSNSRRYIVGRVAVSLCLDDPAFCRISVCSQAGHAKFGRKPCSFKTVPSPYHYPNPDELQLRIFLLNRVFAWN